MTIEKISTALGFVGALGMLALCVLVVGLHVAKGMMSETTKQGVYDRAQEQCELGEIKPGVHQMPAWPEYSMSPGVWLVVHSDCTIN